MKKKILYLSQVYPYPADGGGKIKTLNTLVALSKKFEVYTIFISEKKPNRAEIQHLKDIGVSKVKFFFNEEILASVKDDLFKLTRNFLSLTPHYVFQYTHPGARIFIQQAISEFQPDIIHIDHINIAQYLPSQKKEKWILEHHNVEYYLLWTRFIHSEKWSRKLYLLIESVLTFFFELRTMYKFDHIFTISENDATRVRQTFKVNHVTAQPLVYPVSKLKRVPSKIPYLLFIGGLGWPPNEDAVEWFITKMWRKIHNAHPKAEFHVVGKSNPVLEKNLPMLPNVFLHGYQKDLDSFLKKATIFVLPFRMGGGVRLKALTALSHGIPLVSTPLGIEGLYARKDSEYVEAKTPAAFSIQVNQLLKNSKKLAQLAKSATNYMKKYHEKNQNTFFLQEYEEVTQ